MRSIILCAYNHIQNLLQHIMVIRIKLNAHFKKQNICFIYYTIKTIDKSTFAKFVIINEFISKTALNKILTE